MDGGKIMGRNTVLEEMEEEFYIEICKERQQKKAEKLTEDGHFSLLN